jgi:dTDP-4-amino-4,6-dideoxygalactose transaminase
MSQKPIPFNRPHLCGKEPEYIREALQRGHTSGDGPFSKKCQKLLEEALGVPKVLLTTSGTDALEMAALLLDIKEGDEVVVPSFTFVSTINAFVLRGAKPRFVDIRPDTLNMDETRLEPLLSRKTKAVVPVHYGGVGCEMDAILGLTRDKGITLVEDNAHGLFAKYRGKSLGTFGSLAIQSFHETKNYICGEGGALVVNDPAFVERAEILREKGTDRSRFFRGMVDKYTWRDIGSSFVLSDLLAAFLLAQLESRREIDQRRQSLWNRYAKELSAWAAENEIDLPHPPAHCEHSHHVFYLLLPTEALRDAFIQHMKSLGILCVFHFVPLHLSPMGRKLGGKPGDCPQTELLSGRLVRLPLFHDLQGEDHTRVLEGILQFNCKQAVLRRAG